MVGLAMGDDCVSPGDAELVQAGFQILDQTILALGVLQQQPIHVDRAGDMADPGGGLTHTRVLLGGPDVPYDLGRIVDVSTVI